MVYCECVSDCQTVRLLDRNCVMRLIANTGEHIRAAAATVNHRLILDVSTRAASGVKCGHGRLIANQAKSVNSSKGKNISSKYEVDMGSIQKRRASWPLAPLSIHILLSVRSRLFVI